MSSRQHAYPKWKDDVKLVLGVIALLGVLIAATLVPQGSIPTDGPVTMTIAPMEGE